MKTRASADKTRDSIIKEATKLFVKHGFNATSISQIAKAANINQSLIYHHFGNKEGLWKSAKATLIEEKREDIDFLFQQDQSLNEFITRFFTIRFELYQNNPNLLKLIQWQQMENNQKLFGINKTSSAKLLDKIQHYQNKKQARSDVEATHLMNLLIVLSAASYNNQWMVSISSKEDKKRYLDFLTESAIKALA